MFMRRIVSRSICNRKRFFSSFGGRLGITLIGPPGSGKGTQSASLQQDFGVIPISTGDLLRAEAKLDTPTAREISEQMKSGGFVSNEILLRLIENSISGAKKGWVLDGYPRNAQQAQSLDQLLNKVNQSLTHVFYLNVDEKVVAQRIKDRWIHPGSGRLYHKTYNPPKIQGVDDVTGEPLVQRADDNEETVIARIVKYKQETLPVIQYYESRGLLQTIRAATSKEGYVTIKKAVQAYMEELR